MVKRKARKQKSRKATRRPAKRKAAKRKPVRRKKTKVAAKASRAKHSSHNRKAQWNCYRSLQKRANEAWAKLRSDVKKKAPPHVLLEDRNHLLLLLGECDYMARECMRMRKR